MRVLLSRPARTIAGATLAAILTGIVVNALVLQQARHSAPFFSAPKLAPAIVALPPAPAPAMAESAPIVRRAACSPANLGAAIDSTLLPPSRAGDPIRDLLRGDADKEATHLTIAAQNALINSAIQSRRMASSALPRSRQSSSSSARTALRPSIEITAKLVRQLGAAATRCGC